MSALDAVSLSNCIYDKVVRMQLDWKYCVTQCYDGASVTSGWANGIQAIKSCIEFQRSLT